jgi:hypothetical protein
VIVFDLECVEGHLFEGWFNDLDSFEEQKEKGLIDCPYCGNSDIKRVLSPVTVKHSSRQPAQPVRPNEDMIDYSKLAKAVVDYLNTNFEDVGTQFTKEALKIHYGVEEKRNIRGVSTPEEEKVLREEGVEFFKIPKLDQDEGEDN